MSTATAPGAGSAPAFSGGFLPRAAAAASTNSNPRHALRAPSQPCRASYSYSYSYSITESSYRVARPHSPRRPLLCIHIRTNYVESDALTPPIGPVHPKAQLRWVVRRGMQSKGPRGQSAAGTSAVTHGSRSSPSPSVTGFGTGHLVLRRPEDQVREETGGRDGRRRNADRRTQVAHGGGTPTGAPAPGPARRTGSGPAREWARIHARARVNRNGHRSAATPLQRCIQRCRNGHAPILIDISHPRQV